MQNAPAFRLQSIKTERQVRVCEFQNRTLFLHLPAELVQRLNMPEAFMRPDPPAGGIGA